jgi:hypothetical protein
LDDVQFTLSELEKQAGGHLSPPNSSNFNLIIQVLNWVVNMCVCGGCTDPHLLFARSVADRGNSSAGALRGKLWTSRSRNSREICVYSPDSTDTPWNLTTYYTKKLERRTDARGNMAKANALGDPLSQFSEGEEALDFLLNETERLAIMTACNSLTEIDGPRSTLQSGTSCKDF